VRFGWLWQDWMIMLDAAARSGGRIAR
jgi:hypothetical protein